MPNKKQRQIIYREFLGRTSKRRRQKRHWNEEDNENYIANEGMYHRVDFENGKIRILVLDTRWFRGT